MTSRSIAGCLGFALLFYVTRGAQVTLTNNCQYTVWPGTLSGDPNSQLASTGFELPLGGTESLDLPSPWSGRFWGRTGCSNDNGRFSCATADCGTGQVECNGSDGTTPTTLVEITVAANGGQDFYDVSNVDGFNVPISITPQGGGSGTCKTSSCPAEVNAACPAELQVKVSDGNVIACKSACVAFDTDQYCCTGDHNTAQTCLPTNYSEFFKQQCPDAYSYAYDDNKSTFTCSGSPDYAITFCPIDEVTQGAKVTFINNCPYPVWPGTLSEDPYSQLSSTGFELAPGATSSLDLPSPWYGRFWGRAGCSNNGRRFSCATADCGTGQVACNGNGGATPASLVEITVAANGGQDFYDVSNVDGFNLPMSVSPQGGSGTCKTSSCPANINAACPEVLQVKGSDGSVIACKSACAAFNQDQYCCRGAYDTAQTCPATNYFQFFKQQCLEAYSYAFDDLTSTFTCSGSPNYAITYCP